MELSEDQKLEIGQMLIEGVSEEGINAIIDSWIQEGLATKVNVSYAPYTEYGLPPIDEARTVEGSLSEPPGRTDRRG